MRSCSAVAQGQRLEAVLESREAVSAQRARTLGEVLVAVLVSVSVGLGVGWLLVQYLRKTSEYRVLVLLMTAFFLVSLGEQFHLEYILIAMAGVFLSKALEKYEIGTPSFAAVGWAAFRLSVGAITTLATAAAVEAYVAPRLIAAVFT